MLGKVRYEFLTLKNLIPLQVAVWQIPRFLGMKKGEMYNPNKLTQLHFIRLPTSDFYPKNSLMANTMAVTITK